MGTRTVASGHKSAVADVTISTFWTMAIVGGKAGPLFSERAAHAAANSPNKTTPQAAPLHIARPSLG